MAIHSGFKTKIENTDEELTCYVTSISHNGIQGGVVDLTTSGTGVGTSAEAWAISEKGDVEPGEITFSAYLDTAIHEAWWDLLEAENQEYKVTFKDGSSYTSSGHVTGFQWNFTGNNEGIGVTITIKLSGQYIITSAS